MKSMATMSRVLKRALTRFGVFRQCLRQLAKKKASALAISRPVKAEGSAFANP